MHSDSSRISELTSRERKAQQRATRKLGADISYLEGLTIISGGGDLDYDKSEVICIQSFPSNDKCSRARFSVVICLTEVAMIM